MGDEKNSEKDFEKEKKKKSLIFVSSKETGEKILQELQVKKVRAIFLTADNKELEEQAKTIRTISEIERSKKINKAQGA